MRDLINLAYWRMEGLTSQSCASDMYYVKLAKRLRDLLLFTPVGKEKGEFLCVDCAMLLAHYFEDVITGVGIWKAFTSKHKELYGKYLPFYDIDEEEYMQDEINPEDVRFLVWMALQNDSEETFVNPENPYLTDMANYAYNLLDSEFEKAPINIQLLNILQQRAMYTDFFNLKLLCVRLTSSYLFRVFTEERIDVVEDKVDSLFKNITNESQRSYVVQSLSAFSEKTGPLALYVKEWLSEMLKQWGLEEESRWVEEMEALPYALYSLKHYDDKILVVEGANGKEYRIPRDSFQSLEDDALRENKILLSALVRYKEEWLVNGIANWLPDVGAFEEYKANEVAGKDAMADVYSKIIASNGDSPLFYFRDDAECFEWLKEHIGCANEFAMPDEIIGSEYLVLFIAPDTGAAIIHGAAQCIKDPRNPYYDVRKAENEGLNIVVSPDMTPTVAFRYLLEHNLIPDARINSIKGPERGRQLVQENIDFIARFMRGGAY